MKQKIVVISCVPSLTPQQEAGMLQLFEDLKSRGVKAYLYMHAPYTSLSLYELKKLKYSKPVYKYYYYKTLLRMNQQKWRSRIRHYFNTSSQSAINQLLRLKVKEAVRFLCTVNPDLFICWNSYSAAHGIVAVTAKQMGIKTAGMEWGLLPQTFVLDGEGTLASSVVYNKPLYYAHAEILQQKGESIFNQLTEQSISLYAQLTKPLPAQLAVEQPGRTKILLLGIDMVDTGCVPDHDSDREGFLPFHTSCLAQALAFAKADTDFDVIYKPHPSHNFNKTDEQVAANCWVINSNPDQLIDWADVVVCSGSKMELSVLLKNKPLITVGAGILYKKGCSYEVHRPDQLRKKVLEAKCKGFTLSQLASFKTFLGYLHTHYLYSYTTGANNDELITRLLTGID